MTASNCYFQQLSTRFSKIQQPSAIFSDLSNLQRPFAGALNGKGQFGSTPTAGSKQADNASNGGASGNSLMLTLLRRVSTSFSSWRRN
jgi:hypothetical protein